MHLHRIRTSAERARSRTPAGERAPHVPDTPDAPLWEACIARLPGSVVGSDEVRLNAVYNGALMLYPVDLVHVHANTPLMGLLGDDVSGAVLMRIERLLGAARPAPT